VARAKANGRRVKLGEASVSMSRPGSRGLAIALSKKARRALGRAGSAKVTVTASGRDTVGNTGASSASRTLR
jgi:hypothetical protein